MAGNVGAAVALRGAALRFGQHVIWEDLDLDIAPGECLAVLGPNGAGKSTLLKVLLGLLPLSAGTVTIDGRPPGRGNAQTGYVPQQRDFDRDLPIAAGTWSSSVSTGTAAACRSAAPTASMPSSRRSVHRTTRTRRSDTSITTVTPPQDGSTSLTSRRTPGPPPDKAGRKSRGYG
jgi:ABC-type Mn2+/Zn2+ transport system ATPase subunit